MNKKVLFFVTVSIALVSIICLFTFRIVPTSKIWDSYNVLYVEKDVPIQTIRDSLEKNNLSDVLYPDHAPYPLPSPMAPVQFHNFSTGFNYDDLQSSYFVDSNNEFNLFYIPKEFTEKVSTVLKNEKYTWGLDTNQVIPAIPFIITIIFSLVLFFLCKNKIFFTCVQVPFILLTIVSPYYHIGAAVCLLGIICVLFDNKWNRKYFTKTVVKEITFYIVIAILLLSTIFVGIKSIFHVILCILLSLSALSITKQLQSYLRNKQIFIPLQIHNAKTIPVNTKLIRCVLILIICSVGLLSTFAIVNSQIGTKSENTIAIPKPIDKTKSFSESDYIETISNEVANRLPDLTDYISTAWHYEMYPHVRLVNEVTKIALPGDSISSTEYVKKGNSLTEQTKVIATFDNNYINNAISNIDSSMNSGAEKLLASQSSFSRVIYDSTTTIQVSIITVILMLCICIYCIVYFLYLKIKRL